MVMLPHSIAYVFLHSRPGKMVYNCIMGLLHATVTQVGLQVLKDRNSLFWQVHCFCQVLSDLSPFAHIMKLALYITKSNYISRSIGYIIYIELIQFSIHYQQIVSTMSLLVALIFTISAIENKKLKTTHLSFRVKLPALLLTKAHWTLAQPAGYLLSISRSSSSVTSLGRLILSQSRLPTKLPTELSLRLRNIQCCQFCAIQFTPDEYNYMR